MKRIIYLCYLLFICANLSAQTFRFYYSEFPKFMKNGTNDTLRMPYTGGLNAPQFSHIDYNNDGKQDLFVFDRSSNKVLTFTRDTDKYVYTPQFESMFPKMTGWVLLRDINGDGKPEIFTDISVRKSELRDTIQEVRAVGGLRILRNLSTNKELKFKAMSNLMMDTGQVWPDGSPISPGEIGINNIDIPAIDDVDGDGDIDILCYTIAGFSPTYYENFAKNKLNIPYANDTVIYIKRDECWGYMMFDAYSKDYGEFMLHKTKDELSSCGFQNYGKSGSKHAGTTQLLLDVNGDGVKDVISGDVGYKNLVLLTNGRKQNSLGRDSIVSQDIFFPSNTTPANFIMFPAAYYVDVDADDKPELVVTTNEPVAAKSVDNVWVYNNTSTTAALNFEYAGNNLFIYDQTIDLGTRSAPTFVDIDNDGDEDLVVATSGDYEKTQNLSDRLVLFENITNNQQPVFRLKDTNFLQLSRDTPIIHLMATFGDLNGDGKKDLIVGNEAGQILYYINETVGADYKFTLQTRKLGNLDVGSHAAPALFDMNNDGTLDLIIGNMRGYLKYYQNMGTSTNPVFESTPTIDSLGKIEVNEKYEILQGLRRIPTGYAVPYLYDLDSNGKPELFLGSESGKVFLVENISAHPDSVYTLHENIFVDYSDTTKAASVHFGSRSAPAVALLDGDSRPDIMIGNIRGGLTFYASTDAGIPDVGMRKLNANANFSLYPNPAANELNLTLQNMNSNASYEIYDMIGKLQLKGTVSKYHSQKSIDISGLQNGIYVVVVKSGEYIAGKKLLISK